MGSQPLISRLLTRSASWLCGEDLTSRTGQALAWLGDVLLSLGLASGLVALVVVVAVNLAEGLVSLVAAGGSPLAIAVAIVFLVRARLRARRSHGEADEASPTELPTEPVAIPIERVAAIDTPPAAAAAPPADKKEAPEPELGPSLQAQPVAEPRAPFPRRHQPVTQPAAQWASHEGGRVEARAIGAEDEADADTDDVAPGRRANAERRRRRAELELADLIAEAEHQRREGDGAERSPASG